LAVEPQLQKSWVQFFDKLPSEYAPNKMAQSVELALGLKVGATLLQRTDWDKLKVGDAVILDQGSYDPRKEKGAAYLTLGPLPLFQVKIKQNKIQLVDYAFTYEEKMDKKMAPESPENPFSGPAELLPPAGGEAMALKEMPVHLTVELARLRVTLEKLMQLSPGNLIELPISPDQGVQLTVNGQLVGRGELVHLGEALGIRILEIG
jgi:flagellar motor switch protein FliN/FliY